MIPFTPSWLADDPSATALLSRSYADPAARRRAAQAAAARRADPAVIESLAARTPAQERARDALARPGAAAVVTGQQAGLFGGPLYTIFKAASAIVDARALTAETGVPCVPVFWLQNEDHDYDEIATAHGLGQDGRVHAITVPARPGDEGRSISARRFDEGVDAAVDALAGQLGALSEAGDVLAAVRAAYRPGRSPDACFRDLVEGWLADEGLLVLDPRHPALAEAARPVHEQAIARRGPLSEALQERADALAAAGYAVQVHVRPGAPLSFLHPDGADGPRTRVDPDGDGFRCVGTERRVSLDALVRGPHSTSALLRPILQDTWLPTAAYVGGPGEIAYFAQLPPLYEAFGLPMPLVVPRARFVVVDEAADRLLAQLALTREELSRPREVLLARLGGAGEGPEAVERAAAALLSAIEAAADPAVAKAAEKTAATVREATGRLAERWRRELAERDSVAVERLDRALARLWPHGEPQERVLSWPWFGARYGRRFVEAALAATAPFDGALRELRP